MCPPLPKVRGTGELLRVLAYTIECAVLCTRRRGVAATASCVSQGFCEVMHRRRLRDPDGAVPQTVHWFPRRAVYVRQKCRVDAARQSRLFEPGERPRDGGGHTVHDVHHTEEGLDASVIAVERYEGVVRFIDGANDRPIPCVVREVLVEDLGRSGGKGEHRCHGVIYYMSSLSLTECPERGVVAYCRTPQLAPPHGLTHTQAPDVQTPLRLHSRSLLQLERSGAAAAANTKMFAISIFLTAFTSTYC